MNQRGDITLFPAIISVRQEGIYCRLIALPSGIISSGFIKEYEEEEKMKTKEKDEKG